MNEVELRGWFVRRIAAMHGVAAEAVDIRERFNRLGVSSLEATRLAAELSTILARPVSPVLFWEHPSVEALARCLSHAPGVSAGSTAAPAPVRTRADEPIAIVGMACRFPGAPDPASFWRLLSSGGEAITDVPADRSAEIDRLVVSAEERRKIRRAAWLERIDTFDPFFFGISPREATAMDPQQRLALELCWEALEDAGIRPDALAGSRTGVFAAAIWSDYAMLLDRAGADRVDQHTVTGWHHSIIANRISYLFGLSGPSLTLDAACSSGLVTVHLACESLRRGECTLALAPAVNLTALPESALGVARFGALSAEGRCHTFDARANGYVRGEGGGVVVLKRLSQAIAEGDRIHAVIRGSAVNNDGASNGLTAPSPKAQEALLREACERARVDPRDVQYVEAHGTGTPLGDPIEAKALGAVFGVGRAEGKPLLVGSAKTNVGHLEGAAGIVGLIKVASSLQHRQIPPSLHFETPNPHIPFSELGIEIPTALRPFPAPEKRLLAGVSAFGLGGTNAHVVMEEWPPPLACASAPREPSDRAFESPGVVFVFPGQGAQWQGMARFLLQAEPAFRSVLVRCDAHVRRLLGFSLIDELVASPEQSRLDRIDVSLPAIISIDIAMAALFRSRGIEPAAVVGHSTGEIAAAHVAGALDLEDTMRVICAYGRIIARFSGRGSMALIELPWERAAESIETFRGRVFPAIWDSADTTVLAGEPAAIDEALAHLAQRGVSGRRVAIDVAPHCPLVDGVRDELEAELRTIRPRASKVPFVSEVTGTVLPGTALDAAHWVRNFGDPALFSRAVAALIDRGHRIFVDVGPHPITRRSVEANLRRAGVRGEVLASMVRGEDERTTVLDALARLERATQREPSAASRAVLLPLSAKTKEALSALASAHAERLSSSDVPLPDIAYTTSVRRSHFEHRLSVSGASSDEIARALRAFAAGGAPRGLSEGRAAKTPPKVVFVFPGQGSQWVGMGQTLLDEEPAFRAAIEACDAAIRREAGFSVIDELRAGEAASRLAKIDVVQPVLFAVEVALAALWRSWGIEPAAVVGHSMGEAAAAHVAGALSLEDAAAVICRRSRILRAVSGRGAMALVELPMADAEKALAGHEDRLSVAVSNGPRSTVIAGDPQTLDGVLATLADEGVFCRRVKVDVASHSPQMDPLRGALLAALDHVSPRPAQVPMRSTVTGAPVRGDELVASYWADNLRRPVRFSEVVQSLLDDGHPIFLEMSPHPILLPSVEENLRERRAEGVALASIRRGQPERASLLESLGQLHVMGCPVAWTSIHPDGGRVVDLPSYPWQRERYWIEGAPRERAAPPSAIVPDPAEHPLLGASLALSARPDEHVWEQRVGVEAIPYLVDHRVQGEIVFPGAGYAASALAAVSRAFGGEASVLERIAFEQMLCLPPRESRRVQLVLSARGDSGGSFVVSSRAEGSKRWTKHASGAARATRGTSVSVETTEPLAEMRRRLRAARPEDHYRRLRAARIEHGPAFQGIVELWTAEGEALAKVRLPEGVNREGYEVHPAWLDACLQVSAAIDLPGEEGATYVPVGIERLTLHRRPASEAWVSAKAGPSAQAHERAVDLRIFDEQGSVIAEIRGLRTRRLEASAPGTTDTLAGCVHEVVFRPTGPLPEASPAEGAWLVLSDQGGVGAALADRLSRGGRRCARVTLGESYSRGEPGAYRIDPTSPADYRRLLRDAFGDEVPCCGAIHLGSLDATPFDRATPESLDADLARGSLSATYLAQALVQHGFRDVPRLSLITRGAQTVHPGEAVSVSQAPILALGKTISIEHPELACKCIDIDFNPSAAETEALAREVASADRESQIALRGADRYVARLSRAAFPRAEREAPREPALDRPFELRIPTAGALDRLSLHEVPRPSARPGEVVIEVEAAGLNFKDVLIALGAIPDDAPGEASVGQRLGGECAGRVVALGEGVTDLEVGAEVVALGAHAFGSFMAAPRELVAPKPARLSWEEAATFPVVFLTAHHALGRVARLQRGERVLIHAGAGGVGLAAIQWAMRAGAEIFATAGSEEKRAHLRSLGVPHVLDSRSLGFADDVRHITKGEGVDVVLNSLSGEPMEKSLALLRDHGRFVEIGKRDAHDDKPLGLRPFLRNLSFSLVDLRSMMSERPRVVGELLRELLCMIDAGALTPLPVRTFPISRAAEAFQHMAQAKHIGKIALSLKDPDAHIVPAHPQTGIEIREDRTYLITGGLGGLSLSLARRLVSRGARNLVLVGRSEPNPEVRSAIRELSASARVRAVRADVSRREDVQRIFAMIHDEMPRLAGVVHAAGVLDDHTLLEQSRESFRHVFAPKALGAWNLHTCARGEALDFFILYSSAASSMGSPGQANYGAANAFLDALSRERARLGLPSMSVQWGAFAEVGLAAAQERRGNRLASRGLGSLSPAEGLDALERLLQSPRPEVGIMRFDARQWVEFHPAMASSPFFADVVKEDGGAPAAPAGAQHLLSRLSSAPAGERAAIIEQHLLDQTAAVLRCEPARIDRTAPFQSLGVDSLMSLELRNRLEASLGVRLSATVLFTHSSVAALGGHLLSQLGPVTMGETPKPPEPRAPVAAPERAPARTDEPIAIIGMACRFPGGGRTPEAFFQALEAGVDGVRRVSPERWPADAIPGGGPETRWAGLLDGVDGFDAAFFGISPREAAQLDPQHRILLEVTWEALERAGHAADRLAGLRTSVFVGMCNTDYLHLVRRAESFGAYTATGNLPSTAAGRISYAFGLQGPCMTIDTACSSSLAAVHLAAQSLRNGESDLAISGGVNVLLDPVAMRIAAGTQALSPEGRSKAFDAGANGFVRAEGCGVVVLKRLSDAEREGDPILAVIRGSAVNQDGRSSGLAAPNVLSQQALLRGALEEARVSPEEIGYVETHGTGTPLGDPIEFEALREVLGGPRADGSRCVLGALKTNVGHLESAAGVAGLIKAVMCLEHQAIPRNLHFKTLNPRISLMGTPFQIPTETTPWLQGEKPRRAGVSSFGISGTNVHVILEEAPRRPRLPGAAKQASSCFLPLSAKTKEALAALASAYADYLERSPASLRDIGYTASVCRSHFAVRLAVIGHSKEELALLLRAHAGAVGAVAGGDPTGDLAGLARQWVEGRPVDLRRRALDPSGGRVVDLPTYPWQHRRYWLDAAVPEGLDDVTHDGNDIAALERQVLAAVARVLRLDPSQIERTASFSSLGMESLMSLELRNRLEASLEYRLSASALLDHPSVAQLAEHLFQKLSPRSPGGPARAMQPAAEGNGKRCLLTGATGFLGVHLLRNLLQAGYERVYCLVRAEDEGAALRRLRSAMRHYCRDTEIDWGRVAPLLGDLGSPWLGLGERRFGEVGEEVKAIYHNGAMLDFVLPYERLEATNVASTSAVVRMALRSGARLHHVSTIGVLPEGHPRNGGRLLEVEAQEHGRELIPCGYTATKRAAERLVLAARREGLSAVVHRPSIISGSSRTGAWNLDDAVCRVLKGCIQSGAAPEIDWLANLCPVDFVADAIVHVSERPESDGRIFHVANVESTHFTQMVAHMKRRGYALATTSYDDWLTRIEAQGPENAVYPLLPWIRQARPFLGVDYDCSNLVDALKGTSLRCPIVDGRLFDVYFDELVRGEFLPRAPARS